MKIPDIFVICKNKNCINSIPLINGKYACADLGIYKIEECGYYQKGKKI